jgi:hypothetical protein
LTKARTFLLLAHLAVQSLLAHQQPTTLMLLDVGSDRVDMEMHIPLSELELAFGHETTVHPEQRFGDWPANLKQYLKLIFTHLHQRGTHGPWRSRR